MLGTGNVCARQEKTPPILPFTTPMESDQRPRVCWRDAPSANERFCRRIRSDDDDFSTHKGKTWSAISNAIKSNLVELPGKQLAGLAGNQIMVSSDGGANWTKLGPPAPFKPNGITYSEKGKCFYAWQLADNLKKPAQSIVRLNVE